MTPQAFAAILLILFGSYVEEPVVILLGILTLLLEVIRQIWAQTGLSEIQFERRLSSVRATCGDTVPLVVMVWNRKRLPLAWLRAEDRIAAGLLIRERALVPGPQGSMLTNHWTLAPFERVTRHFNITTSRRGVFELGPAELTVGDVFSREAATMEVADVDRLLVRPRTVSLGEVQRRDRWGGTERARRGLVEDPSRFAGVRDYQPGDPPRRVHAVTSARLGRPVVKLFEPAREREVMIALDVQTIEGPSWQATYDDREVESLVVVAASIARSIAAERAAVGLAAAGYSGALNRLAVVAPSASPGQLERILDLLARLSPYPSAPFDRLLTQVGRSVRPGTTILVLTSRDPVAFLPALKRLARGGHDVLFVGSSQDGPRSAARARQVGLTAQVARLDGSWQTAERLTVGR